MSKASILSNPDLAEMDRRVKALEDAFGLGREDALCSDGEKVVAAICMAYGISQRQIVSPSRQEDLVWARHLAMFVCTQRLGLGCAMVARLFRRDVSSVTYAVRSVKERVSTEPKRAREVAKWMEEL